MKDGRQQRKDSARKGNEKDNQLDRSNPYANVHYREYCERLTVFVWPAGTPPSPWPAVDAQSRASDPLLPL